MAAGGGGLKVFRQMLTVLTPDGARTYLTCTSPACTLPQIVSGLPVIQALLSLFRKRIEAFQERLKRLLAVKEIARGTSCGIWQELSIRTFLEHHIRPLPRLIIDQSPFMS